MHFGYDDAVSIRHASAASLMDDSAVQTALCVIGHPIAGNPSQFCILRALTALGLEWQCLSFDVPAPSLPAAIAGIDVLGFAGALIASPHHAAVAPLLARPTNESALPRPAPPSPAPPTAAPEWIDGLRRGEDDRFEPCNFLGQAFAQRLHQHEQSIGGPLPHCVYLGDADSYQSMILPFRQGLPASCFVLSPTGLVAWPPRSASGPHGEDGPPLASGPSSGETARPNNPAPAQAAAAAQPAPPAETPPAENPEASKMPPSKMPPSAAPEDPQQPDANDPLQGPILLFRPQPDPRIDKKPASKTKSSSPQPSLVESILERLHPDSLQIDLAPVGASWQVLHGRSDSLSAVVSPLELEIGRIAVAIQRWTGLDADRDLLAEAIEEYLEI